MIGRPCPQGVVASLRGARRTAVALALVGLALAGAPARAALSGLPAGFTDELVVGGLPFPTAVAFLPDGRMLVALKRGEVRVYDGSTPVGTFVDISERVCDNHDRGLLGLAVHPDFPDPPWVYLLYTHDPPGVYPDNIDPSLPGTVPARVAQLLRVDADASAGYAKAKAGTEEILLGKNSTRDQIGSENDGNDVGVASCMSPQTPDGAPVEDCIPSDEHTHTIGTVAFAPDGSLFVSSGDASNYGNVDPRALRALDRNSLAGKILRIDPATGAGLPDNPFYDAGQPNANRSKVWAYGLRNPFRVAIHPATSAPFAGDVGWNGWEEIDDGKGANFGWPCYEGGASSGFESGTTTSLPQYGYQTSELTKARCQSLYAQGLAAVKAPTFSYDHLVGGGASANAGAFYGGTTYPAAYRGALFIADYSRRWIRYLTFDAQGRATVHPFGTASSGPVQIVAGPDSNLHWMQYSGSGGELRRIRYVGAGNTPPVVSFDATPTVGLTPLVVSFDSSASYDPDVQPLAFAWDFGDGATSAERSPSYTYTTAGTYEATLTITEETAPFASRSRSVRIAVGNSPPIAAILEPADGTRYRVGDVLAFAGSAMSGPNPVPASQLAWELHTLHNEHVHYDALPAAPASGDPSTSEGSFDVDDHGDDVRYELCLTATVLPEDVTDTQCVGLDPERTEITVTSDPIGLQVVYENEGIALATPALIHPVVNALKTLSLLPVQQHRSFVRWADGTTSLSRTFTVGTSPRTFSALYENRPPIASFTPTSSAGVAPLTVTFDGRASSDPERDALAFAWDAGAAGSFAGPTQAITFTAAGEYLVGLVVTDQLGATGTATAAIAVAPNRAPTARIRVPASGLAPLTVVADGSGSTDPEGGTLRFDWVTSDGQRSSAVAPSFRFATPGTYSISLTVTDPVGLQGQASASVRAVTACNDGVDNDGDGAVDYPADKGCASALEDDELAPVLAVAPEAPDLGSLRFGSATSVELTAANEGGDALRIASIALASAAPGFSLVRLPALPLVLAPGSSARFELRFAPQQAGPQTAVVRLASDDPASPLHDVLATGVGVAPRCLDGFLDAGEACDDGNDVEGDGCDANCTVTACGNGRVTEGETCDDGNAANGDGCDANCRPTGCGNGALSEGEQCDDGNQTPADGCGVDCAIDFGAQTPAQRACIAAVDRGVAKIARAQASASLRCLRAAASGSVQPNETRALLDACLADQGERVASVAERALAKARARCVDGELPELALGADPVAGLLAAREEALRLVRALFGEPSRVVPGDDRPAAACQRKALRGSSQLIDAFARTLERALARTLVGKDSAPARNDGELSARVEAALAESASVERAASRVAASVGAACSALPNLPQALPVCAVDGPDAVGGCVAAQSRCSACALALAGNPTLALSCDRLDDGVANASCTP